ncbi:MAG: PTS sugar transporter subunit IIA [Firmicutes bacterium]|nr:PTS sugar transporter subunit IIA [Bacillota bacterium]
MRHVIMVSHGDFAKGLHSAVRMMTGKREGVFSCNLTEDMTADQFTTEFKTYADEIQEGEEIILLADIISGSPITNAVTVLDELGLMEKTIILAGMNMPLALSAVLYKDSSRSLTEVKELILADAHKGLQEFEMEDIEVVEDF